MFCSLLMIFTKILDPDPDRQNVGPDLDRQNVGPYLDPNH